MIKYKLYIKNTKPTNKHPKGYWYLGKTETDNYEDYLGSGTVWNNHLRKNNYNKSDIHTTIIFETNDFEQLKEMGLYYSKHFDVVNNSDWANLINENGSGGFSKAAQIAGGKIGGKLSGKNHKKNGTGFFGMTEEKKFNRNSKVGKKLVVDNKGIFSLTKEEKSEACSKGGKNTMSSNKGEEIRALGGIASYINKKGLFGMGEEEKFKGSSKGGKNCKNVPKKTSKCEHCGLVAAGGMIARWHGKNCNQYKK